MNEALGTSPRKEGIGEPVCVLVEYSSRSFANLAANQGSYCHNSNNRSKTNELKNRITTQQTNFHQDESITTIEQWKGYCNNAPDDDNQSLALIDHQEYEEGYSKCTTIAQNRPLGSTVYAPLRTQNLSKLGF